jgi:hypothetical protein
MQPKLLCSILLLGLLQAALADSRIPLSYVPERVRAAIQDYVPGARLTEAKIDSDDQWGVKYKCDYLRADHKGSIEVARNGHLIDVNEDLLLTQVPPLIRRVAAKESRGGMMRKASLDEEAGRLVYRTESFYGQSEAKIKLRISRGGEVLEREFD